MMGSDHLSSLLWADFRHLEFVLDTSIPLSIEVHPGDIA